MSNPPHRVQRATPVLNLALPIAFWQDGIDRARARMMELRSARSDGPGAFEELSVAEEELRTQNEELARAQHVIAGEEERYRQLFERAPVAYLITDTHG